MLGLRPAPAATPFGAAPSSPRGSYAADAALCMTESPLASAAAAPAPPPASDASSDSGASCASDVCMGAPHEDLTLADVEPGDAARAARARADRELAAPLSEVDAVLARYSVAPLAEPGAVVEHALARIRELVRTALPPPGHAAVKCSRTR
jgi:hypothetical protein